jgi:hypothetical protein
VIPTEEEKAEPEKKMEVAMAKLERKRRQVKKEKERVKEEDDPTVTAAGWKQSEAELQGLQELPPAPEQPARGKPMAAKASPPSFGSPLGPPPSPAVDTLKEKEPIAKKKGNGPM